MNQTLKDELVLVVNHHQTNYQQLTEELQAHGLKVSLEHERINIVVTAESLQPDIILMDISHIENEGLEICHQLKNNFNTQNIFLILITSLNQSLHKLKKLHLKNVDYMIKPVRSEEILARIKIHLALRRINSQLHQEISNRCQVEALVEQSQQILSQKFGTEISELISVQQELETINRELFVSDRELEKFTHLVASDLQVLLLSLEGFTELLVRDEGDRAED
ncbi:response regulator [Myxosarcina sp. GI1(2024)]